MLPADARLTHRDDFSSVIRRGRRAGRTLVVMHVLMPDQLAGRLVGTPTRSRVGFVVSKAVGGSVVRHRVARRLRHVMRDRLADLPSGTQVVVRALPRSADADSARLGAEVDRALRTVASPDRS
ncbi:MAG TPA: ribonuclease P protein component [Pseudonocardia sp.]|uniref:ribonuclease P protein component n=1 Tax=Pseudonocardia sp. TaxID=60912 RepID=UPI002F422650